MALLGAVTAETPSGFWGIYGRNFSRLTYGHHQRRRAVRPLERLGRFEEARSELEEAMLRGGSDDPRMHTSLGVLTLRLGSAAGADEILTAARPLWGKRPPSPAWFLPRGSALHRPTWVCW